MTVSNPTGAAFAATEWELTYQWTRADGTAVQDAAIHMATPLPASVPIAGTVDVTAQVKTPPSSTEGNRRTDYVLDCSGTISYRVTKYEYDQVGNTTKVISPQGVATTDDPDDFAQVTVYDALNRVKETQSAYDKDDARYTTADKTTYAYDEVGRLATMSAPPSAGQSVRNDTTYSYYDNGWTKSSSDPWDIVTSYDYNELGAQTAGTLTSAGGSSNRTMSWSYFPDGKLKARSDDGVPVGKQGAGGPNP